MNKVLVVLGVFALFPLANAQTIPESDTSEFEDFESYGIGAFSGDFGWYDVDACSPTTYCIIVAPGLDGTGKALLKTRPTAGQIQINLEVKPEFVVPAQSEDFVTTFRAQLTDTSTSVTMLIGAITTDANIQAVFSTVGSVLMRGATTACGMVRGSSPAVPGATSTSDQEYTLVFRTNGTVDIFVDGVFAQTEFDYGCGDVDVIAYQQAGNTLNGSVGLVFDQWVWGGTNPVVDVVDDGPSEFDSGLRSFAASAGFISQESQLFFALVLVGLATVTTSASSKWVAPGRFKNYLTMGVQAVVGVFCVIAMFLDLWMFIVALMLGIFAVRGGSEIRNTYFEIREALEARHEREGMDIGPAAVMEVVEVEENGEAVEGDFSDVGQEDDAGPQDVEETQPEAAPDAQEREE